MVESSDIAPRIWLIAGPTASGKSAYALQLAEWTGAEIVNADSMQIYQGLRVLTAGPSPEEKAKAPHHLFEVADAAVGWSVGRWLGAATQAIAEIESRGNPVIVVGGTGLYFRALTHGLAEVPPVPETQREISGLLHAARGEEEFREILKALDPEAEARIEVGDRQRLVRAHAVAVATGKSLTAWQTETKPALKPGSWEGRVLDPPRAELYARCDARLSVMVEQLSSWQTQATLDGVPNPASGAGLVQLAPGVTWVLTPQLALQASVALPVWAACGLDDAACQRVFTHTEAQFEAICEALLH